MKAFNEQSLIWVNVVIFLLLLLLVNILTTEFKFDLSLVKKIPDTIGLYAIVIWIFRKRLWRLPIFRYWLVRIPDLQGTWMGNLQSTWVNPETGKTTPQIEMYLTIKQEIDSLSCVMYTRESESYSTSVKINEDHMSGVLRLIYSYTNQPQMTVRHRSEIHNGAASLKIIKEMDRSMIGEYWTDRKTTGQINLKFLKKELIVLFPE